ncbi:sulfatase-like hydrolase/transferase [Alteromonas sp. KUL49]|uniref:sulfatase-like hydrolase/transferase n=1 Tax=Alteromonas sp. KUL49 TaxID=2480798 RepID=UPI0013EE74C1|nr:sulfatase-like hydrolase/transferase [Alteromonas sp. KUL49]
MLYYLTNAFITLVISIGTVHCIKSVRSQRGALSKALNLDDLLLLLIPAAVVCITSVVNTVALSVFTFAVLGLYGLLVWADAILFVQYRIEINRQTISWFFTGSKGLAKGMPHLLSLFHRFPLALSIPVVWLVSLYVVLFGAGEYIVHILALCLCVAGLCRLHLSVGTLPILVLSAVGAYLATLPVSLPSVLNSAFAVAYVVLVGTIVLLAVLRKLFVSQHPFMTSPTLLGNIMVDDSFKASSSFSPRDEHKAHVTPEVSKGSTSQYYGACKNANIILVTMESLGCYINPYTEKGAISRLAERFHQHSWISQNHYSLCPNTTVSTNQMYTGYYSNNPYNKTDSLFPGKDPRYIKHLKANGYQTLFLDSADTGLYDYQRLLQRIGFDRVWGSKDIPANGLKADYRLWNMVDDIAEQVGENPFFLHVINDQTHMPYEVVDTERFNRHSGGDKAKYLNAVEEVDFILDEFLNKLSKKVDLSNTIVVFTGDHGESFGEFGYSFHSNSVILPQISVPFMLSHPSLSSRSIEHSCHFDLFPTFFDLLGIDYAPSLLGNTLGNDDRDFAYFAHSATLKGNSPANFGFIRDGDLLWMDRLFNQVCVLKSDQVRVPLSAKDQTYAKSLLHKMLSERGILV